MPRAVVSSQPRETGGALQLARVIRRLKEQVLPGELGAETVEHLVRRYSRVRPPALELDVQSRYDAGWPQAFEDERGRLLEALVGEDVVGIEHIGSTSIAGLPSKNILDIAVATGASLPAERQSRILAGLGYQAYGESPIDAGFSWHWRIGQDGGRSFVVHTCAADNPRFADILNFRDFLRAFPEERQGYLDLKQALAAVPGQTWMEYSVFKKVLVVRITARANAWRMRN
ncbi:GrpB family protein [Xanthomonas sp. Sa3BUA13]|nr:GrpB family protein [Xanthomonas surreyensis]